MADFKTALAKTLVHEGGYSNNPADAGGETYKGVSRHVHPTWAGWAIIDDYRHQPNFPRNLEGDASLQLLVQRVYSDLYWLNIYTEITSQPLAEKLFDMGVLMGVKTSIRLLQISLSKTITVVTDGVFGQKTLEEVNNSSEGLLAGYRVVLIQHFINIVNNNPEDGVFVQGWINRVNS
jgi:lysozyme family protein